MPETKKQIVKLSELPASIIIVGVGQENFSKMEKLDADHEPLYSKSLKKHMEADIV